MNKVIAITITTIFFTSCMVGPNFQKVEVDAYNEYRFAGDNKDTTLNLKWWELFNDEILVALIDSALVNNKDINITASNIELARLYLGYTKADMYPNLSYGASGGYGNDVTFSSGGSAVESYGATANLNWEIDFWGKYRRANEAAKAELLATEYALNIVQLSIINEVANVYYALLDYQNRMSIAQRTLESRKASTNIITQRFDKGTVPEIDLNQAQIQEAIAASAIPNYERAIAYAENALSLLTGANPQTIVIGNKIDQQNIPNIPNGVPSQLLKRRPDVQLAEQQVVAQNARIGVAQAMRFPSISLTASGGYAAFSTTTDIIGSVGAGLFGPIFNFGKNKRRVEMEKERTEQAKLNYEKAVLIAFRETEDALINVKTLEDELEHVNNQLAAASNAAKLSRVRYDGGVTSYLEVLESERQLFQVELYHSELMQKRLSAYTNLYKTLGGGWVVKN